MADKALKRKLVVIEEGTLSAMAGSKEILREFPFLASVAKLAGKPRAGCGTCGKASQERAKTFATAKKVIAGMDGTRKRRLKDLMNAQQARVVYVNANGKTEQLTF